MLPQNLIFFQENQKGPQPEILFVISGLFKQPRFFTSCPPFAAIRDAVYGMRHCPRYLRFWCKAASRVPDVLRPFGAQRSIFDFRTFAAYSVRVMRFNILPICRTLRCILHHLRRLPLVFIPSIPPAAPQTIPITRAVTAHAPKLTVCDASPPISHRISV